ncbi:sensor domain-containing diguanylate cyclase [Jeotgalibacillus sp. R-1-5s-1]|uniref:GGDEF domain-containing protein n=1 Tax=Jeotgalibacillus sp. R-1-5s-1 TaxID=2555897 RepID=UPI00106A4F65|nr:sensor domain-containing diguanylate cyclase [Jeotgalibacillus sp. R-1-5s-1]TFE00792.1 diguanylate cyclase [Jeotgalibacillus sp. R-1-5s-1]
MDSQLYHAPCAFAVLELDGRIIEGNKMLGEYTGQATDDLAQKHMSSLLTLPSRLYFQTYFMPVLSSQGRVDEMYLTLKTQGEPLPVLINAQQRDGQIECVLVKMKTRDDFENELIRSKRNVEKVLENTDQAYTELQNLINELEGKREEITAANARLENLAMIDPLTNLKNRRFFEDAVQSFIQWADTKKFEFTFVILDIDHFKRVNDQFGHPVGDQVLQELSWKLEQEIREGDVLARLGGEEFVILLANVGPEKAHKVAERIRANVETHMWSHTPVTISIGLTGYQEGDQRKDLFLRADQALYYSKQNGRNQVTVIPGKQ